MPGQARARERIVIAGASGFIGRALVARFEADGARVTTIGRRAGVRAADGSATDPGGSGLAWSDIAGITAAVDGADLVLGLSGKSVNCRYTSANRAEIYRSRLETTTRLGQAITAAARPPRLWINSSTATIYRHADDRAQTDEAGEVGTGFSVDVATAWERTFFAFPRDGMRQVAIRTAIVLGDGGALTPLLALARLGLGGPQLGGRSGGGRQWVSWIHLDDVGRAIRFLQESPGISGPVNLSSPNPAQNRELMREVRRAAGVTAGLPTFAWMLRLGALVIRTEPELVLKSRWVLPTRLEAAGFRFAHPRLREALADIVGTQRP
ncbi:MAG: TIGR01777 family protein [Burkholderiaceae bacterium]|nr:TIGR01777 family protein [Microbacteriaceae bacterium]